MSVVRDLLSDYSLMDGIGHNEPLTGYREKSAALFHAKQNPFEALGGLVPVNHQEI